MTVYDYHIIRFRVSLLHQSYETFIENFLSLVISGRSLRARYYIQWYCSGVVLDHFLFPTLSTPSPRLQVRGIGRSPETRPLARYIVPEDFHTAIRSHRTGRQTMSDYIDRSS